MAENIIKVKSKKSGNVIDSRQFYENQPEGLRNKDEDHAAFATRMAKEYPDMFEIQGTQEPPSVSGLAGNLASDVWEGVKSLPSAVVAAKDIAYTPIALYKGETSIPQIQNTLGNTWDVLKKQYSEYYGPLLQGDFQKFGSNVYEHPGQILGDVATAATGGELAAGRLGATSAARALGNVAAWSDPVTGAIKTAGAVTRTAQRIPYVADKTHSLAQWAVEQNIPSSVLKDRDKTRAARLDASRTADTMLEHGIPLTKEGASRAESAIDKLHEARSSAVQAAPQVPMETGRILEPHARKMILDEVNNVGTNPIDIAKIVEDQVQGESLGARIVRDKDGNIIGNIPTVQGRSFDANSIVRDRHGIEYHPTLKTPNDVMDTIRKGNKALAELYDDVLKVGGVETKTKALAQKKIIEAYRHKLDELVGDVPVTLTENGKPAVYRFKDLGIDESKLIQLGQDIHETLFNSVNAYKNLLPFNTSTTYGMVQALKQAAHSPQMASRLAVFLKGSKPSTFKKTRIVNAAAHAAKVTTPPPVMTDTEDQGQTEETEPKTRWEQ